jgi:hypothetical protein
VAAVAAFFNWRTATGLVFYLQLHFVVTSASRAAVPPPSSKRQFPPTIFEDSPLGGVLSWKLKCARFV